MTNLFFGGGNYLIFNHLIYYPTSFLALMLDKDLKIGIVGLGYVGLPMACMFSQRYKVVGYDFNQARVHEINNGRDYTAEVSPSELAEALRNGLRCTSDAADLSDCGVIIVAVPTPVDSDNRPDFGPLELASRTIGKVMPRNCIVIYESTVSPGTTEEICVPILAEMSGMEYNRDFFAGYSPERVNPGDSRHTVRNIRKIVSGSTPEVADKVEHLYDSVLDAPTFRASSIRVAEAAKIIENTQRDVNIALVNEFTRIFNAMGIDVDEVIEAAATKWNFHPYRPGLVGGHCIGVDPYYLIHKAEEYGVKSGLIATARNVNEEMSYYLADTTIKSLRKTGVDPGKANILILGFAFKPDCPDIRNTKSYDVYRALSAVSPTVTIYDPVVNPIDVMRDYNGLSVATEPNSVKACAPFDAIVRCTHHKYFEKLPLAELLTSDGFDVSLSKASHPHH